MVARARRSVATVAAVAATATLAGCGGLSGSSTCRDFLDAGSDAQQKVIGRLATQYDKPEFATPLGSPEVPYVCSQNPAITLDELFRRAG